MSQPAVWKIGDRVKVAIPDSKRTEWANGAADALNGLCGKISATNNRSITPGFLVQFDNPAPTWWPHQSPPTSWWFEASEIEGTQHA